MLSIDDNFVILQREWVMGRYLTLDTVLRRRATKVSSIPSVVT